MMPRCEICEEIYTSHICPKCGKYACEYCLSDDETTCKPCADEPFPPLTYDEKIKAYGRRD